MSRREVGALPMDGSGALPMDGSGALPMDGSGALPIGGSGALPIGRTEGFGALPIRRETGRKRYLLSLPHEEVVELLMDREKMLLSSSYLLECSEKEEKVFKKQLTKTKNELENKKNQITNLDLKIIELDLLVKTLDNKIRMLSQENVTLNTDNVQLRNTVNYWYLCYCQNQQLCTYIYCNKTNCTKIHENHPRFNELYLTWVNEMKSKMNKFRSHQCYNKRPHRAMMCHYSHQKLSEKRYTSSRQVTYVPNTFTKDMMEKGLPTPREKDYSDPGMKGDSLHDPTVIKEQLDQELDEYWVNRKN